MADPIAFVDLKALYAEVRDDIDAAIRRVLDTTAFIGGREVARFEEDFAAFTGAEHVIGVANGTDALELSLMAFDLPRDAGVIVPANTFIATAEAVVAAGLRPVFVDVDPETGLVDLERCEEVAGDVAAMLPVHLYGRLCDMDAVMAFARRHDLRVVEDSAQAHAARRGGRHAGTFGDAGCFSFYPGKNLGAMGDGGAVVTNDPDVADRVRLIRDHGRRGRDRHVIVGRNSRLDGLQAAILSAKLPHLERWTDARRAAAAQYRELLDPALLDWPGDEEPTAEAHHLFPILSDERDAIADRLKADGVATGVHYRVPVHVTEAFGERAGECPVAERRAQRQLSLPIHPHLRDGDVARVCAVVNDFVAAPR